MSKRTARNCFTLLTMFLIVNLAACTTTKINLERTDPNGATVSAQIEGLPKDWSDVDVRYGDFSLKAGSATTVDNSLEAVKAVGSVVKCVTDPALCRD